jgi:hypothetical protein
MVPQVPQFSVSTFVSVQFPPHSILPVTHGWHTPFEQLPLWQSLFTEQFLKAAHGGQVPPPQSTSVSFPFLMPSVQVAVC